MTPLRQRLIDELLRRNYAKRTVDTYVAAVARIARHFHCSSDQLTREQLRDYWCAKSLESAVEQGVRRGYGEANHVAEIDKSGCQGFSEEVQ